jgi:hypothetical protein
MKKKVWYKYLMSYLSLLGYFWTWNLVNLYKFDGFLDVEIVLTTLTTLAALNWWLWSIRTENKSC